MLFNHPIEQGIFLIPNFHFDVYMAVYMLLRLEKKRKWPIWPSLIAASNATHKAFVSCHVLPTKKEGQTVDFFHFSSSAVSITVWFGFFGGFVASFSRICRPSHGQCIGVDNK